MVWSSPLGRYPERRNQWTGRLRQLSRVSVPEPSSPYVAGGQKWFGRDICWGCSGAPGDYPNSKTSRVLLFVEGCAGIWGTLLPSSESSSAGSSRGSELLLGQHEIFVEFNMKVNNAGATSLAARLGSLFMSPHGLSPCGP